MKYRMIAIDLDGTLLNRDGRISQENNAAIVQAQQAGVMVVPCTGRAWRESKSILDTAPLDGLGVFVGGAVVGDINTGKSLDFAVIEPHLVEELVLFLSELPEAVLVFREAQQCGHDYLVTGRGSLTPATQWWFETTGATVHFQRTVTADDLHHALRVGIVAEGNRVPPLSEKLREAFGQRVLIQHFQAVNTPDPDQCVYILEIFAAGVDKWRGLEWIADRLSLASADIAAIGDEINDVAMLKSAGCGIAMANAVTMTKEVADYTTLGCDEHGVAYAIEQLLAGRWG